MTTGSKAAQLFKQIKQPTIMDDYFHHFNLPNALNVLYWFQYFKMVEAVEGDIVECGVGRGRSLISILSVEALLRTNENYKKRSVYALDSFEGFPEPTSHDISWRDPAKGEWAFSPNNQFKYSPTNLTKILELASIPDEILHSINIIPGYFDKSVHRIQSKSISLLHLDGDLYESVLIPLKSLKDKIAVGGIVVFDDFTMTENKHIPDAFPGARKACREFMNENDNFLLCESMRGTPYLLKKF